MKFFKNCNNLFMLFLPIFLDDKILNTTEYESSRIIYERNATLELDNRYWKIF